MSNEPMKIPGLGPNPARNERDAADVRQVDLGGGPVVMYRPVAERLLFGLRLEADAARHQATEERRAEGAALIEARRMEHARDDDDGSRTRRR